MNKYELEIKTKLIVTDEDIDDIMCTALEGGITYWCDEARVVGDYLGDYAHEQIVRGGTLLLEDAEEDETYELTKEKFLKGIQLARDREYFKEYNWWDGDKIDTCSVDADVADVIIQLALFDEVVFG